MYDPHTSAALAHDRHARMNGEAADHRLRREAKAARRAEHPNPWDRMMARAAGARFRRPRVITIEVADTTSTMAIVAPTTIEATS